MTDQKHILTELKSSWPETYTVSPVILSPGYNLSSITNRDSSRTLQFREASRMPAGNRA
jgi:hypothetical protein